MVVAAAAQAGPVALATYAAAVDRAFPFAECNALASGNAVTAMRVRLLRPITSSLPAGRNPKGAAHPLSVAELAGANNDVARQLITAELSRPEFDAASFKEASGAALHTFTNTQCSAPKLYRYEELLRANGGTLGDPSSVGLALSRISAATVAPPPAQATVRREKNVTLPSATRRVSSENESFPVPARSVAAAAAAVDDDEKSAAGGVEEEDDFFFDEEPMTQMPDHSPQRARAPVAPAAAAALQAVTIVLSDEDVMTAARRVAGRRPDSASRGSRFQKQPKKRKLDERHESAEEATWDTPDPAAEAGQAPRSSKKRRSKERVTSASTRRKTAQVAAKHKAKTPTPKRKFIVRDDDKYASEASEVGGDEFSASGVPSPRHGGSARKGEDAAAVRRVSQKTRITGEAVKHVRHAREQAELKRRKMRGGKVRAKRVPFTAVERDSIIAGVQKYKKSHKRWADILAGASRSAVRCPAPPVPSSILTPAAARAIELRLPICARAHIARRSHTIHRRCCLRRLPVPQQARLRGDQGQVAEHGEQEP